TVALLGRRAGLDVTGRRALHAEPHAVGQGQARPLELPGRPVAPADLKLLLLAEPRGQVGGLGGEVLGQLATVRRVRDLQLDLSRPLPLRGADRLAVLRELES